MADAGDNGRDAAGRFAAGNPGGPGGSHRRVNELRRAIEEAVSPQYIGGIMKKATMMAIGGNLAAMRLVLERTLGRVAEAPVETEPLGISIPHLRTAADCTFALERVGDAFCKGTVDREGAKILIHLLEVRLKAIEVGEQEQRLPGPGC